MRQQKKRYLANVREDTGEVLGICTDRYALVQTPIWLTAPKLLLSVWLTDFEREAYVTDNGSKSVNYDFKGHDIEIPEVGDTMGSPTLQNPLTVPCAFRRSVCSAWFAPMECKL